MEILDSDIKDLKKIALCHRAAFPESLTSKLGLNYCMKMLSFYLVDERGLLFHLNEGEEIVGYCGGLMNKVPGMHGSATSMTQYTFKALTLNVLIRPWLIFNHEIRANLPLIIRNINLKLLGRGTGKTASSTPPNTDFIPSMGLVVIGVSPRYQGKGYGSLLLQEFELRARKEGLPKIHLTVKRDNYKAISAYKRNGWSEGDESAYELHMLKELL